MPARHQAFSACHYQGLLPPSVFTRSSKQSLNGLFLFFRHYIPQLPAATNHITQKKALRFLNTLQAVSTPRAKAAEAHGRVLFVIPSCLLKALACVSQSVQSWEGPCRRLCVDLWAPLPTVGTGVRELVLECVSRDESGLWLLALGPYKCHFLT